MYIKILLQRSCRYFHISSLPSHAPCVVIQSCPTTQSSLCSRLPLCSPPSIPHPTCTHMGKNQVCKRNTNITNTFFTSEAGMISGQLDDIKSVNRQQRMSAQLRHASTNSGGYKNFTSGNSKQCFWQGWH